MSTLLFLSYFVASASDLFNHYSSYITYAAFLVGVLAILVTALIGWQIFNFLFIKKEMNDIVKSALKDFQKDSVHVLKGVINMSNSKALLWSRFAQALDDVMISLEEVLKSKNADLNKFAIELLMDNLTQIETGLGESQKFIIYKGRRSDYLRLLKRTNHSDKDKFISMIGEAEEIDCNRNDDIRMVAENDLGKKS